MREKFVSQLGSQPQISSFTHWHLNHSTTKTHIPTRKQTPLWFIFQSKTLVNVILCYNSNSQQPNKWSFSLDLLLLYILTRSPSSKCINIEHFVYILVWLLSVRILIWYYIPRVLDWNMREFFLSWYICLNGLMDKTPVRRIGDLRFKSQLRHKFFSQ